MIMRSVGRRTKTSHEKAPSMQKRFLNTDSGGHISVKYRTGETVSSQGSSADVVFYVLKGAQAQPPDRVAAT
jgi:hypothetical protein